MVRVVVVIGVVCAWAMVAAGPGTLPNDARRREAILATTGRGIIAKIIAALYGISPSALVEVAVTGTGLRRGG